MLKGIDPILIPDLIHALAKMGHGETVAVVDRNYPPHNAGAPVVHLAGVGAPAAVAAICSVMPLDTFVEAPLAAMEAVGEDERPAVSAEVVAAAEAAEGRALGVQWLERFAFYAAAKSASLVVATGEARPYGCYLLTKGVWPSFTPGSGPSRGQAG
jgi:L-fucose mutarotase